MNRYLKGYLIMGGVVLASAAFVVFVWGLHDVKYYGWFPTETRWTIVWMWVIIGLGGIAGACPGLYFLGRAIHSFAGRLGEWFAPEKKLRVPPGENPFSQSLDHLRR